MKSLTLNNKQSQMTTLSSALAVAGILFGSISSSYAALDFKTYAAAECAPWNESADPASYLNSSRKFNPSTTNRLFLDCPAAHDRIGDVSNSWIRVIDRNPTDRVCAQLVGYSHIGASVFFKATPFQCTSVLGASPNSVQLNTGGLTGIPMDAHYYFSVQALPKRFGTADSGVVSYFVDENVGID